MMASRTPSESGPTGGTVDDRGERASLLDGALATLRNPIQMAVILALGALMGLCFAAGQAPREIIIGSAGVIAAALFGATSSAARQAATIGRYAKSHGVQFVGGQFPRFLVMPNGPQRLGAYPAVCQTVLIGRIGGGPPGMIAVLFPNVQRYRSSIPSSCLPIACYDVSKVGGALGPDVFSVWTANGRVASDSANGQVATALLDPELAAWLVKSGGVSFEFSGG